MTGHNGALLTGSLATFQAQDVLQWMGHHPGEGVLVFEIPKGQGSFHGSLGVHIRAGVALSVKTGIAHPSLPGNAGPEPGSSCRAAAPAHALEPQIGTLGAILLKRRIIASGELRYALALQWMLRHKRSALPLGGLLQRLGLLVPEVLEGVLKDLALHRLAELFDCNNGRFTLFSGSQLPPFLPVGERLDRLLLRVAHLVDQFEPDPDPSRAK